jgi:hypothetical protein
LLQQLLHLRNTQQRRLTGHNMLLLLLLICCAYSSRSSCANIITTISICWRCYILAVT